MNTREWEWEWEMSSGNGREWEYRLCSRTPLKYSSPEQKRQIGMGLLAATLFDGNISRK